MFIKKTVFAAIFFVLITGLMIGGFHRSFAQEDSTIDCSVAIDKESCRNELLRQIEDYKKQIEEFEGQIENKKKEQKTLQREMTIIGGQIKKQELEIKKTKLHIDQMKLEINDKEKEVKNLEKQTELEKAKLKEHLSKINEYDNVGILEMMLRYDNLSDFFSNITAIENLENQTYEILQDIRKTKDDLANQIDVLEEDKVEALELKSMLETQRSSLGKKEKEKKNLITQTKGEEKKFQALVIQHKKKIADIQSRLFEISSLGVGKITIENAVKYAELAGRQTGIRPAFILGLIWVESRLNSNLGTGNWKTDMYDCYIRLGKLSAAEAQKEAFFNIIYKLVLNPDKVPVSRALTSVGCGGAMGIAQFMPTTWSAYESKISLLGGNNPSSPWNVLDGFLGAAIKLADNGAISQDRAGERKAAAMYYAGSRWQRAPGQNYADRVRTASFCYQDYMDALKRGDQNIDIESDCEKYF